jgi:hypothetical protein
MVIARVPRSRTQAAISGSPKEWVRRGSTIKRIATTA